MITHFGNTPSLASISAVLGEEGARIQAITTSRHHEIRSIELVANVDECPARERLKQRIMAKSREFEADTAIQRMKAYRKSKRLVLFDMDSTLVDMEIIDEMARQAGVYREVAGSRKGPCEETSILKNLLSREWRCSKASGSPNCRKFGIPCGFPKAFRN